MQLCIYVFICHHQIALGAGGQFPQGGGGEFCSGGGGLGLSVGGNLRRSAFDSTFLKVKNNIL